MILRAVFETVTAVLLTAVFAILIHGLVDFQGDWQAAFLDEAPRAIATGFLAGGIIWVLALIIGNVVHRMRAPWVRFLTNAISLLAAAIVNVVVWAVFGFTVGGWAVLLVAIAIFTGVVVLGAGLLALVITHFVFFRTRAVIADPVVEGIAD